MTLAIDDELAGLLQRLGPYARRTVDDASRVATYLHAEELTPEHLLVSILGDEECGATRLVLHAFGDPETIRLEVMALCPGIMVVGSQRSLPFSLQGVEVLELARSSAAERGDPLVDVPHLFSAAAGLLPEELALKLESAAWSARALGERDDTATGDSVPAEGPLFRFFAQEARKALGAACRQATRLERDEISPVHLVLGCLDVESDLARVVQTTMVRVRTLSQGHDADPTGRPERMIHVDGRFRVLLGDVAQGAGTTQLLSWILTEGGEEVRALLNRQRITPKLIEHAGASFDDPS